MGWQIIQQPNGKFCVHSTVVDNFMILNLGKRAMIGWYGRNADSRLDQARKEAAETIEQLEKGGKPYYQFTMSFEEALVRLFVVHGYRSRFKMFDRLENLGIMRKMSRETTKALYRECWEAQEDDVDDSRIRQYVRRMLIKPKRVK